MSRRVTQRERRASARQVRWLRARLGLSRAVLAERLMVSVLAVKSWELGTRLPSAATLALMVTLGQFAEQG